VARDAVAYSAFFGVYNLVQRSLEPCLGEATSATDQQRENDQASGCFIKQ
jgi:hypothetical protein